MPRSTLADIKASRAAAVVGMCPDEARFISLVNEAQQRLLNKAIWYETTASYQVCINNGCLVWPRQFAAIESIWLCGRPITIRGEWFEYLNSGFGLQGDSQCSSNSNGCGQFPLWGGYNFLCGGGNLLLRQNKCSFSDIIGTNKKIKVYCDVAEEDGAKILLQGYDENNQWIRTLVSGSWVDGEYVALNVSTPQLTTKIFTKLTGVQKPDTNGNVRLYEYNTDTTDQRAIAVYEPDENIPDYRASFIPGICNNNNNDTCSQKVVGVIAKLAFIKAKRDTDYLIIGNIPALKLMIQAINKEENSVSANDVQESMKFEQKAIKELQTELQNYRGQSVVQPIRMQSRLVGGAGVLNMQ